MEILIIMQTERFFLFASVDIDIVGVNNMYMYTLASWRPSLVNLEICSYVGLLCLCKM